jgi:DTW domain-containing protein YfiP
MKRPLCYCNEISPIAVQTNITVVMHVAERERVSNTVRLLELLVPQTEVVLYGKLGEPFTGLPPLPSKSQRQRYLLFPESSAHELTPEFVAKHPHGIELVVPDGTWSQAKRLAHRAPGVQTLPRVTFTPQSESAYVLRRNKRPGGLCTLEAIAAALRILEGASGEHVSEMLLKEFDRFIARILWGRRYQTPFVG